MRRLHRVTAAIGLLAFASLPLVAAMPADDAPSPLPVALAQPVVGIADGVAMAPIPGTTPDDPWLSESGLLVLVGTGLIGLASVVRRTSKAM